MNKRDFQLLLRRYRNGKCTEAEMQKIDIWFDKIEDKDVELNEFEKEALRNEIMKGLPLTGHDDLIKNRNRLFSNTFLKVAAAVTLFIAVGYYLYSNTESLSESLLTEANVKDELIALENPADEILQIHLPDGSAVSLQPKSKISYAKHWDKQIREVNLVGEAFFEIVTDNKKPFFVHCGDIVTKVLGTSFIVRALPDAEIVEVKVRTGKVSVYKESLPAPFGSQPLRNGVILTPNQQVKYFKENKQWVTGLVDEPRPLRIIKESSDFVFDDATLKSIITQIEKDFSIQIVVEHEGIYTCTFTGDVTNLKLFEMLEVISKSIGVTFEVAGTMILINGKGCN